MSTHLSDTIELAADWTRRVLVNVNRVELVQYKMPRGCAIPSTLQSQYITLIVFIGGGKLAQMVRTWVSDPWDRSTNPNHCYNI